MPKQKTHKGIRKRMRLTRTGKVVRRKAGARHLLAKKTGKRVRQLRKATTAAKAEVKRIKRLLSS